MKQRDTRRVLAACIAGTSALIAFACSSFSGSSNEDPLEAGLEAGFCMSSDASFCADFDEEPFSKGWDKTLVSDSGSGAVSRIEGGTSLPYAALMVATPRAPDGGGTYGAFQKNLARPNGTTGIVIDMDVRFDALPGGPNDSVAIAGLVVIPRSQQLNLNVSASAYGLLVFDPMIDGGALRRSTFAPATGKWVHLRLTTSFTGSASSLVVEGEAEPILQSPSMKTSVVGISLTLGALAEAESTFQAAFDNVVVRFF